MRTVGIGHQDFVRLREQNYFYIDKTDLIRQWWESGDEVTLVTRPRRFGKTLNLSMLSAFFSVNYAGRADLFEGMEIWKHEAYRSLQGTYPVIVLSFAGIKENTYQEARESICRAIEEIYNKHDYLLEGNLLNEKEKEYYGKVHAQMNDSVASVSLRSMADYLSRYYGKKTIILLDEYDTPMQEAYVNGFWEELASFIRGLLNSAFKTNPYLERAFLTGITRVSRESVFSDLNNLEVITTTTPKYETMFGFTEEEVFTALEEYGLSEHREEVKLWYDGFTFGNYSGIYNPWSIINYLSRKKVGAYWANTSSNSLISKLLRESSVQIKESFEAILAGHSIRSRIEEQIVYNQLDMDESAVWSLLLASGYLKVKRVETVYTSVLWEQIYELEPTNFEVRLMFRSMVQGWFSSVSSNYNDFLKALLLADLDAMNEFMSRVALRMFSYFDAGGDEKEPERFYHGFVLGMMVDLDGEYRVLSNRESGFGRYDIVLEPRRKELDAFILEFKVRNPRREKTLEDTVQNALAQIDEKKYETELLAKGIPETKIRKYGIAFQGKRVLIG